MLSMIYPLICWRLIFNYTLKEMFQCIFICFKITLTSNLMPQTHALRRYNYNLFLISRIFQFIHFFSRLSFISLNHSLFFFFLFNIFKFPRALASPPQLSVGGRVLRWMFYPLSLLSTMKHRKNIKSKIRHCLQAIGGEKVARARLCSRASIKGHLHLVPSFPAYFSFPCSGLCPPGPILLSAQISRPSSSRSAAVWRQPFRMISRMHS